MARAHSVRRPRRSLAPAAARPPAPLPHARAVVLQLARPRRRTPARCESLCGVGRTKGWRTGVAKSLADFQALVHVHLGTVPAPPACASLVICEQLVICTLCSVAHAHAHAHCACTKHDVVHMFCTCTHRVQVMEFTQNVTRRCSRPAPGPTLAQRHPTRVHVGLGPRAPLGKVIRIAKRSPHDQRSPRKFWLVQRRVQLAAFSSPWPSRDHATELSQHIDATTITGGTEEESHAARTHTLPGEHDTHRFRSADDPSGARPLKAGPNGDARCDRPRTRPLQHATHVPAAPRALISTPCAARR